MFEAHLYVMSATWPHSGVIQMLQIDPNSSMPKKMKINLIREKLTNIGNTFPPQVLSPCEKVLGGNQPGHSSLLNVEILPTWVDMTWMR